LFDEVNVSALNEQHNTDFTTEKENRKSNGRKRKTAVPSEWKRHKTKLLRNTGHTFGNFKRSTDASERKIAPLRATRRLKCFFRVILAGKALYFQKTLISGRYHNPKNSEFKCVNVTLSKTRKSLKVLQIVLLKEGYFDYLLVFVRKYDDLQS
jgi:hypothetical protein